MKSWIEIILKFPRTIIATCILITLLLGWHIPKLQIEPDIVEMLPQDLDIIVKTNEMEDTFGGSELVVISISAENIFSRETFSKIKTITEELEGNRIIDRVISLSNAPDIISTPDGFEVRDLMEGFDFTTEHTEKIQQRIKDNEMLYGMVVSEDFLKTAIVVIMTLDNENSDDDTIYNLFNDYKHRFEGPEEIHIAGLAITRHEIAQTMNSDIKYLFPFGIILMVFFLVLSFRSWLGAFLPFVVVIMSIVCTMGFMALLGWKLNFLGIMIPVMLIAIANDYSIHLVAHYFADYKQGQLRKKNHLIKSTLIQLRTPVFLAGITTLIGFLSLQSHILPAARELGLIVSIGITIALIFSLTFVPAALKVLNFPITLIQKPESDRTDRFLQRWGRFFVRHKGSFLLFSILFTFLMVLGIPRIYIDTNPVFFFRESSEIRKSNELIDQNFGGSSQLMVLAEGDIKSPDFLAKMDQLANYLDTHAAINHSSSIVDQIKMMNRAFHGDSAAYDRIPESREMVAQYLFLYSLTGDPEDLDRLVDYNYEKAQILARINESSTSEIHRIYRETNRYIEKEFNKDEFPTITGMAAYISVLADMVVKGQIRSLILSIVLVCLVSALIFKSLAGGLLAIVPLSSAIIMVFGLMGFFGITLNMATVMISSIMIGVGIDYTIHFIYRYRLEVHKGASAGEAVERTLLTSGKGIIYNALSVIVGFLVLTVSGFLPIYFFGFLIVISIATCLVGALTIMPAILVSFQPGFIFKQKRMKS
ncbi:MAG TPA: RND family transporter [Candidatus Marinimicrobia bacterium]|nr:RND family transporter [Candidatus Neomarinimicrobiota bacterium]